ncbi:uncharacterized protein LOC106458657 [Limulus polyphemus]|uniref:Uncharacterized protein LOC106458657 n=1 Tax=Limulus polyphemus TaxID=6850 RepID=A0ABM1B2T6_LIMPO|nr:uncharacterized protein LOC106458657 [Limulus polyphemus]
MMAATHVAKLFLRRCKLAKKHALFSYISCQKNYQNCYSISSLSTSSYYFDSWKRTECAFPLVRLLKSKSCCNNVKSHVHSLYGNWTSQISQRSYSVEVADCDISFEDLEALIQGGDIQLIDVREPQEINEYGTIPGSVNIPLGQVKDALLLTEDAFQNKYKVSKPQQFDANIVFFGLGPIKARAAVELAHKFGYTRSRMYRGGWEDYTQKTGQSLKRM